jgi:hypothetical protein
MAQNPAVELRLPLSGHFDPVVVDRRLPGLIRSCFNQERSSRHDCARSCRAHSRDH